MRNLTTIVFLFIIVGILPAQPKPKVIELKNVETQKDFNFQIDTIIDLRANKAIIGTVRKGLSNRAVPAVFPYEFNAYLEDIMQRYLPNSDGPKISLVVHEFSIQEKQSALSEKAIFHLDLGFAIREGSNFLEVYRYDEVIDEHGLDATAQHAHNINKGFVNALYFFQRSDWESNPGTLIQDASNYDFDHTTIPKKGIYTTFNKLAQNQPEMESGYVLKPFGNRKHLNYKLKFPKNEKPKTLFRFISDGENLYVANGIYNNTLNNNVFTKASAFGKYIYVRASITDPAVGAAFGALGAMASTNNKGVVIFTETGEIKPLTNEIIVEIIKEHPEISQEFINGKQNKMSIEKAIIDINKKY